LSGVFTVYRRGGREFTRRLNKQRLPRILVLCGRTLPSGRSCPVAAADEGKIDPAQSDPDTARPDTERLDTALVAALYLDHAEELRRFLLGVLGDAHLAGDVLQATFTKLVERGHETREESRKAWLFRVAYHEAMAIRRRQNVGHKAVTRLAWTKENTAAAADQPLLRLEAVESVRAALDELPSEQRQIVRMRIYEEKTFAVIAEELDIPLGTALGRMRAALGKLKKMLGNQHS
jgi:RNA polymerase sigma-70 factor (ECF subfamily)